MNLKNFVILSLIITSVFTITLTETIQISDGLLATISKLNYELESGETQLLTWNVINNEDVAIKVEFYADGDGSELLVYEQFLTLAPKENKAIEVIVVVPDNIDNVEYRPILHVLQKGTIEEGKSGMIINIKLNAPTTIKIGDNPIYTPPVIEEKTKAVIPKTIVEEPKQEEITITPAETLEEKLARIQAANEETIVDDTFEETTPTDQFEVKDPAPVYVSEPMPDPEPEIIVTNTPTTDKTECDFVAWFLSLIGIGKC